MSYALTNRTWKDSYKNVLQMRNTSFDGIKSTYQKVIDGYGNESGIEIGASGMRITEGKRLDFQNDGAVYIYRPSANKLRIVGARVAVNGGLSVQTKIETASLVAGEGVINKGVLSNLSVKKAVGTNASFGQVDTALAKGATASFGTVKGNGDFTTADVNGGKLVLNESGGNENYLKGEGASINTYVAATKTYVHDANGIYPATDNAKVLGSSGRRFSEIRTVNAFAVNSTANKMYALSGGVLSNLSRMSAVSAQIRTVRVITEAITPMLHFDSGKSITMEYDAMAGIVYTTGVSLAPKTDNQGSIGTAAYRYKEINAIDAKADTITGGTVEATGTLKGEGIVVGSIGLNASALPASSAGLNKGDFYQVSGALMVVV